MRTEIIRCATLSSLCRCVELFKLSAFCRATVDLVSIDTGVSRIAIILHVLGHILDEMIFWKNAVLNSALKHEPRIVSGVGII